MRYLCCDERRRNDLKGNPSLNGIDFLEVVDKQAPSEDLRQRILKIHFVNDLSGITLDKDNFVISGGERITGVRVETISAGAGPDSHVLTAEVDRQGDFSPYKFKIVKNPQNLDPPDGIDPMLAEVKFSFKVECPSPFDCQEDCYCVPEELHEPEIDYLAKDYASFRRLMLDRMTAILPDWKERNPADMGVALVELLAYVGDYLSYQQDAIGTEAYLDTARRRISVRRHALLVDYHMHDGCNARTWVQVKVSADVLGGAADPAIKKGVPFSTRIPDQQVLLDAEVLPDAQVVFESMHAVQNLFEAHNRLTFYTWSDRECCLPRGSTSATLEGQYLQLNAGDVLIFEELLGPRTGRRADADPDHRQAVRLTSVDAGTAAVPKVDPLSGVQITEIEWLAADALRFPLCISGTTEPEYGGEYLENISVALGNIVLVDHGLEVEGEPLGEVPQTDLYSAPDPDCDPCDPQPRKPINPRFRPLLKVAPLTQQGHVWQENGDGRRELVTFDPGKSASDAMRWDMDDVRPAIILEGTLDASSDRWQPQRDLLNSDETQKEFVVEIESNGRAQIRFGDDQHGARPEAGTGFLATYRVGNGAAGNIGSDSIVHILSEKPEIAAVRNPLPASGGVEPETIEEVRRNAPQAFRTQERAVTKKDYAERAEEREGIQRAAASFRWTGSWHTVFVTADRFGGQRVSQKFEEGVRQHLERYRMAGYDLEVDGPKFVPLEIEMYVCVGSDFFRSDVQEALLETFSARVLPGGRRGVFHPDNFTFGETVYLSPLYAAAQAVAGVESVRFTKFQRLYAPDSKPVDDGWIELGELEIARLDNDPNFREHGVFDLIVEGGK